ncbi:MAG: SpoIIE family protein phosphatase [Chloroflexi bacterium]|nr:SpoIIE family protein phosphatase [Chloroflexota bacterium]
MTEQASEPNTGRLQLVYQLSKTFNSSLDLDDVLNTVMDEVISAVNAERGFVVLKDPDDSLVFRAARGMEQETLEAPEFEISRGVVGEVIREGQGVITSDAQHDERFMGRQSVMSLGLRSILCSPLQVKDQILGAIYVDNRLHAGIFNNEDLELLNAIASSAATAIENARLYLVAVDKGRMERELSMARTVQTGLIPEEIPELKGWQFAASWLPAREVAGDFYDFIATDDEGMGLVIADVTDKGMGAALFMALTRSMVRASLEEAASPAEAITKANRLICANSSSAMPVTFFYGRVGPEDGEMVYVNAGHNPPLIYRADSGTFEELGRTGILLGVDESLVLEQGTAELEPGDTLIMYTDGVPDALNSAEEAYGEDRMRESIKSAGSRSAQEISLNLLQALQQFIGDAQPFDDITLLLAKRE